MDYDIGLLPEGNNTKQKIPRPAPVFIHCSLSDFKSDQRSNNNRPQVTAPVGFDRLRESGFSEEDVRNIRTRFHRMNGTLQADSSEISEQAITLEEQWMDNTGETLPDGSIICLFWFRESVFTHRHQMGIVAGILINISFGLLHVYY
ncbi:hypothetical protein [Absidia glauca]|uniref:DSC E3 ubiquitin ligase complex subunit 3 C-terminal domain-containing protein n=1 Tax=Absidia glauca TaxID=4829 RepID=A0A168SQP2_ABSGL|nr:hypothetical protein [Absidia glauca]